MKVCLLLPLCLFLISIDFCFGELDSSISEFDDINALQSHLGKLKTIGLKPDRSINGCDLIGVTVKDLFENYSNEALEKSGICKWFGKGPLCGGYCPSGYEKTLRSKWPFWESTTFGGSCFIGKKNYCCPTYLTKKRWAGQWSNLSIFKEFLKNMWCSFDSKNGPCGSLKCMEDGKESISNITGNACNELNLFGNEIYVENEKMYFKHYTMNIFSNYQIAYYKIDSF